MENWKKRPPPRKIELVELFCLAPTDILICYLQRHMILKFERRSIDFACIYTTPWRPQSANLNLRPKNRTNRLYLYYPYPPGNDHISHSTSGFKENHRLKSAGWDGTPVCFQQYIHYHIFWTIYSINGFDVNLYPHLLPVLSSKNKIPPSDGARLASAFTSYKRSPQNSSEGTVPI